MTKKELAPLNFPNLFCRFDHLMNRAPMEMPILFRWITGYTDWSKELSVESLQQVIRRDYLMSVSASRFVAIHADPVPKIHTVYVQMGLVGDK